MQLDAMFLQLGIAGAALFVMYRVAMRWMTNEGRRQEASAKTEEDRARIAAAADSERTKAIQDGFRADIAAHQAITGTMQKMANQFSRIEGKLDTILDLTPIREQYHFGDPVMARATGEPKVIVDDQLPVERTPSSQRQTPPGGTQARQTPSGGVSTRQTPSSGVPAVSGPYSHISKPLKR